MQIIFSDEKRRLTPDIKALMDRAADIAITNEAYDDLKAAGLTAEDIKAEVSVTIVDDDVIRALNRDYRGNDSVTDVLSFPQFDCREDLLSDMIHSANHFTLIGDVVICFDQAARQAEEYGTGMERELLYLFVHSIMHLFGYDHMNDADKKVMRLKEESVLSEMGVER